jgi:GNAT superfamily N-acetyltransferase
MAGQGNPTVDIRLARPADSDGIATVHVASWRETYVGLVPDARLARLDVAERAGMWRRGLERDPPALVYVATVGAAIVGFANGGPRRGGDLATDAELYALYVLRAHQRGGLGRALFARVAEDLRRGGAASLGLWVLRDNALGRGFYDRMGGRAGAEKRDARDGYELIEVAYTWPDIASLRR